MTERESEKERGGGIEREGGGRKKERERERESWIQHLEIRLTPIAKVKENFVYN